MVSETWYNDAKHMRVAAPAAMPNARARVTVRVRSGETDGGGEDGASGS